MNSQTVSVGGFSVRIWKASDNRWKWHTHKGGKRVLCAATALDKAKARAKAQLVALRGGRAELASLEPSMLSEFLAWRKARIDSPKVSEAVPQYMAHLSKRKVQETRIVASDLSKFATAHSMRMADVTPQQVEAYLSGLGVGARRHNNVRSAIVSFFRWARKLDLVPDAMTAPERTHALPLDKKRVAIYTPTQFKALLSAAPEEWKLALAIGGMAGLRTEEIAGLRWEDIKLSRKLIEVRPEICKTGRRRLVPIQPALVTWIKYCLPNEGNMVMPSEGIDPLVKRLRRAKVAWVKNGLRHSYGSYRCAAVKSAGQVALEMGNSEAIVRAHYLEMVDARAARTWFQIGYFC
jgi:integrase